MAQSNSFVAQAKDEDLKPRIGEWFDPEYWEARRTGNKEKQKELEEYYDQRETAAVQAVVGVVKSGLLPTVFAQAAVELVNHSIIPVTAGFADAVTNNLSVGVVPRQESSNTYFRVGQKVGDTASLAWGMGEIGFGGSMIGTGGVATVGSGGALAWVGAPAAGAGIALTGHGAVVSDLALKNLLLANYGRVYAKGKQSQEVPTAKGEPVQYKVKKAIPAVRKALQMFRIGQKAIILKLERVARTLLNELWMRNMGLEDMTLKSIVTSRKYKNGEIEHLKILNLKNNINYAVGIFCRLL